MIALVVALRCEAEPLIEHYRLASLPGGAWPIYQDRAARITLVVGGVGVARSAAATGFIKGVLAGDGPVGWLNAGIAGHSSQPVGTVLLANRVIHRRGGRDFYPVLPAAASCGSCALHTVSEPETRFDEEGLYDMEGAGFALAAAAGGPLELVQLLKVVSDNPSSPAQRLDRARISELVAAALGAVGEVVVDLEERLATFATRRVASPVLDATVARMRFSVTQLRQLRRLLDRCTALSGSPPEELPGRDARSVLQALGDRVDSLATASGVAGSAPTA